MQLIYIIDDRMKNREKNIQDLRRSMQTIMRSFPSSDSETPCGIKISTSFAHVLFALYSLRGVLINQQLLARELSIDKSTIARLCGALEEQGFIKVTVFQDDKRNRTIQLSTKGLKLAKKIKKQGDVHFGSILDNIPRGKVEDVLKALKLLTKALALSSQQGGDQN